MAITLIGEVVNSCDSVEGFTFKKRKKPKKGAGPAAASFWK